MFATSRDSFVNLVDPVWELRLLDWRSMNVTIDLGIDQEEEQRTEMGNPRRIDRIQRRSFQREQRDHRTGNDRHCEDHPSNHWESIYRRQERRQRLVCHTQWNDQSRHRLVLSSDERFSSIIVKRISLENLLEKNTFSSWAMNWDLLFRSVAIRPVDEALVLDQCTKERSNHSSYFFSEEKD